MEYRLKTNVGLSHPFRYKALITPWVSLLCVGFLSQTRYNTSAAQIILPILHLALSFYIRVLLTDCEYIFSKCDHHISNKRYRSVANVNSFTAPNTMICGTVYTKRVRKNNTSTHTHLSLKHCIIKCALYQHYAVFEY